MSYPYNRKIQSIIIHHPGDGRPPEIPITKRWNPFNYQFPEYDYGIEYDGTIQIGRPLNYQGAHCISDKEPYKSRGNQWFNQNSIGIAVAGDFTKYQISKVQLFGLVGLVQKLMKQYNIPISEVMPHRQVTYTECPGNWDFDEFLSLVQGTSITILKSSFSTQSSSNTNKPLLKLGSQGSNVQELQNLLTNKGYNVGGIDGWFGQKTLDAVKIFQADNHLDVDGIVFTQTWNKLLDNSQPIQQISIPSSILWKGNKYNNYNDTILLQKTLNAKGYNLQVDGDFGQLTKNAVIDFQSKHQPLIIDGIIGQKSWNALLKN